ncbi:hypothetical protein EJV47_09705 [Hymenobacter gummosus]|uniref:DUF3575 domain-containing protein n=1 Tax=Hymenobacter gummosus TaxID=1776032 RepID=A0A3S0JIF0_9BACT|nr:hypothetical protein [Hymenobacter gummosus]RTQ50879.1 hypothetical protein EJV47_09705 [Hymenobacter gummosus]
MRAVLLPPGLGALAVLLLPGGPLLAQQADLPPAAAPQPQRPPTLVVKFNVFQPLVRGYHLEIEKTLRAFPRHSLGLTLQGYCGPVTELTARRDVQPDERVRGYGAELLYRLYFPGTNPDPLMGFYLGLGPHVQRFELHFQADGWQQQLADDGLKYYQYGPLPYRETIRRQGAAVVAGYQGPLDLGPLTLDFYVGLGWRQSSFRSSFASSRYRSSDFDYGARGFYFPIGFKLGAAL